MKIERIVFGKEEFFTVLRGGEDNHVIDTGVISEDPDILNLGDDKTGYINTDDVVICTDLSWTQDIIVTQFSTSFAENKDLTNLFTVLEPVLDIDETVNYKWCCSLLDNSDMGNPIEHRAIFEDYQGYYKFITIIRGLIEKDYSTDWITEEMYNDMDMIDFSSNAITRSPEFVESLGDEEHSEILICGKNGGVDVEARIVPNSALLSKEK